APAARRQASPAGKAHRSGLGRKHSGRTPSSELGALHRRRSRVPLRRAGDYPICPTRRARPRCAALAASLASSRPSKALYTEALAASAAFPPFLPPVAISNETLACDKKDFPNPHYLSDGGVYDNLGIDRLMWYHRQRQDLDVFVISDAEGKFDWDFDARYRMP